MTSPTYTRHYLCARAGVYRKISKTEGPVRQFLPAVVSILGGLLTGPQLDGYRVISPALIKVAQGLPNQIVIQGPFPEDHAREAF